MSTELRLKKRERCERCKANLEGLVRSVELVGHCGPCAKILKEEFAAEDERSGFAIFD
jgi:hypothetical protein